MGGPCTPYITEAQVKNLPLCPVAPEDEGPDYAAIAAAASEVVYVLLGRQHPGVCRATVRPVRRGDDGWPRSLLGVWLGDRSDYCTGEALPLHDPIFTDALDEEDPDANAVVVKIDGEPFTDFYVRDRRSIVRYDGKRWPTRQRLQLADTEVGTWSVTYSFGAPPPRLVVDAALELAAEYVRVETSDPSPKLPPGTTNWSRGGFSGTVRDEAEAVRTAGSALPAVAKAMGTYNPANVRLPALVSDFDREWDLVVV